LRKPASRATQPHKLDHSKPAREICPADDLDFSTDVWTSFNYDHADETIPTGHGLGGRLPAVRPR